jgi:Smg protein
VCPGTLLMRDMTDNGSVLDILIYVFDRYMLADAPEVPEREELAQDLEQAGFAGESVERALDWLADLAGERDRPNLDAAGPRAMRVYTDEERTHLPADCRGYLLALERSGILSPQQREIVIERLLALDASELDVDQLKWVVLMVLSSQPGEELACARMEDLVFDLPPERPH